MIMNESLPYLKDGKGTVLLPRQPRNVVELEEEKKAQVTVLILLLFTTGHTFWVV